MKILVTGGTGFLGQRLIEALVKKGEKVVALSRSMEKAKLLLSEDVEIREGDIRDFEAVKTAMNGCDRVFHAASLVSMWERDNSLFDSVNVEGTGVILKAAEVWGIKKTVYTSSFMALGPSGSEAVSENSKREDFNFRNDYERTKYLGYEVAQSYCKRGLPIVYTFPGVIYGPGLMTGGNIVVSLISDYLAGKLPGTVGPGDRQWCYSYIDDVVEGHIKAMEKGSLGKGYILGGDNRTMNELFQILEELTGVEKPGAHLPYWLCSFFGLIYVLRARLFGVAPKFTHQVVNVYKYSWAYRSDRAIRELNYKTSELKEGIEKTLEWMKENALFKQ